MQASRPARRLGPSGLAVVGTGVVETLVRLVPDALQWVIDSRVGAVLASTAINVGVQAGPALAATQWAFLLVVFYFFTPTVLPGAAGERAARERPFRALLAVAAGAFAIPVVLLGSGTWLALGGSGARFGGYVATTTFVVCVAVGAYLSLTQDERLADPTGPAYALVLEFTGTTEAEAAEEYSAIDDRPGWTRTGGRLLGAAAVGASYAIPLLLFGLLGGALNAVFPVLEVLVLLGVLWETREDGDADATRWPALDDPEVEETFYDHLTAATRGTTGAAATIVCVLGVLAPVAAVVVLLGAGLFEPRHLLADWSLTVDYSIRWLSGAIPAATVGRQFASAVAETGELLAIPVAAGYATWYWYRRIQRLPAVLSGRASSDSEDSADDSARTCPTRPPGMVLPAAALSLGWKLEFELSVGRLRGVSPPIEPDLLFAALWTVLTLVLVATYRRTVRLDGTESPADRSHEGLSLLVAFAGSLVVAYVVVLPTVRALALAVLGALLMGWLYCFESVADRAEASTSHPDVVVSLYGLGLVVVSVPAVALDVAPPVLLFVAVVSGLVVLGRYLSGRIPAPDGPSTRGRDVSPTATDSTTESEEAVEDSR